MKGNCKFDQKRPKAAPAQALVELAIILPILLLLILGAMDFGRMFITKIVLTNAAREGANYLAYNPEDSENYVTDTLIPGIITDSGVLGSSPVITVLAVNCCTTGNPVEVKVTATNIPLIFGGFYKSFFNVGEELTLTSTVKMQVQ